MFIALMLAAALHDLGHVSCAWILGVKVKKWRVFYNVREPGTDMQNLLITAAGPLTNLLLAGIAIGFPWLGVFALQFGLANFAVGFVNLIPTRMTDGHRLLALLRQSRSVDTVGA